MKSVFCNNRLDCCDTLDFNTLESLQTFHVKHTKFFHAANALIHQVLADGLVDIVFFKNQHDGCRQINFLHNPTLMGFLWVSN